MSDRKTKGHVIIQPEECKGCEMCIDACPEDVLYLSSNFNRHGYHTSVYTGSGCTGCGICYYTCPEPGAITVFKRWADMEETAFCKFCGKENKVFHRQTLSGEELVCRVCLKPVGIVETENI